MTDPTAPTGRLAPTLPPGYLARPVTDGDLGEIHALVAAAQAPYGLTYTGPEDIAADLARPGLVRERDTVLVRDRAGAAAGWAWVERRSEVDVHPQHRGRGLGAALLDWVTERGRQAGARAIVQSVPDGDTAAGALLRSRGYEPLETSWRLEFVPDGEPDVPGAPDGVTVRMFEPGDARAVHAVVEGAFEEWQGRRKDFGEWAAHTVDRTAFAPGMSALAFAGDELVGAVVALALPDTAEGYVEQVAVRADHRRRGIAGLLLRHTFRAFHRADRPVCTLWTHSATGALGLYTGAGMTVRHSSTVFRREW